MKEALVLLMMALLLAPLLIGLRRIRRLRRDDGLDRAPPVTDDD